MLAAGALAGLVGGAAAQVLVGRTLEGDAASLARVVFVMPVATFVLWWVLVPGVKLDRLEPDVVVVDGSVEDRIQQIEQAFGDSDLPHTHGAPTHLADEQSSALFRRSIRRARPTTAADVADFGIRRPAAQPEAERPTAN